MTNTEKNNKIKLHKGEKTMDIVELVKQLIRDGRFIRNNILSEDEFSYIYWIAQNINVVDEEMLAQLNELLDEDSIEINIGDNECEKILSDDKTEAIQLMNTFPYLEDKIVRAIHLYIIKVLKKINGNPKIEINDKQKECFRNYFKYWFDFQLVSDVGIQLIQELNKARKNPFISNVFEKEKLRRKIQRSG